MTPPNPSTESAVRAADHLRESGILRFESDDAAAAQIISTECHLPELKEVLGKAKKALKLIKDQAEFYCKNYCQPVYGKYKRHHADCPIHYATDTLEALAALEKVKI